MQTLLTKRSVVSPFSVSSSLRSLYGSTLASPLLTFKNPKLFGLSDTYASGTADRTLTLIASALQKIANLTIFEEHEKYSLFWSLSIINLRHLDLLNEHLVRRHSDMKRFIDLICDFSAIL